MTEISDLAAMLHPDLADYVVESGPIGPMLHHPLIIELFLFPDTVPIVNKQYAAKKEHIERALSEENYRQYVLLHERPYRLSALEKVIDFGIPDREYWRLVSWVFSDSENIHQNIHAWIDLWGADVPFRETVMDSHEQAVFTSLPDEVTVFRGTNHPDGAFGLSWTLSKAKARWFARRYAEAGRPCVVLEGSAQKSTIWAYLNGRGEQEVVIDPRRVKITKSEPLA